mgnify:CR=1 FL=1
MHLDPKARDIVEGILQAHLPAGVVAFAFGSRTHGQRLKPFSDLDICLKGAIDPDLVTALAAAFRESDLPIKVDVVDWNTLAENFRAAIARDLVPIFPEHIPIKGEAGSSILLGSTIKSTT